MRKFLATLVALLLVMPTFAGPGGRSGGSSSSSSSSRSSSSSSRSSRPPSFSSRPSGSSPSRSASPSSSPSRSGSYGSFSKPSAPAAARPQAQAAFARSQQAAAAASASKQSLAKFKAPPVPAPDVTKVGASPVFGRTVTAQKPSYQTYTLNRQSYYRSYQPPTYVYNMRPSYGMWDAMFMWMMLDNMNHNAYYHHRQDADWQAWRADANKQAETNAELKAKLAAMDAKVKELEGQKVPVNPAYMPEGVDPAIAVAPAVAEQNFRQEAPPQNPDAVDWTEEDNTGEVLLWIFGVMAAAFCIIGGAMWFMSRRRSNSFRSNYWN